VLQLLRLMGAIALEGIVSMCHLVVFLLFRRRVERARVHELILGYRSRLALILGAVIIGSSVLSLVPGCSGTEAGSDPVHRRAAISQPGTSFDKQVQELTESLEMLWNMDDAQQSLEDDLRVFGDPEPGELWETIALFGW